MARKKSINCLPPYYSVAVLVLSLAILYGLVHIPLRIIGIIVVVGIYLVIRLKGASMIALYGAAIMAFVYALLYRFSHANAVAVLAGIAISLFALVWLLDTLFREEKQAETYTISFAPSDTAGDEVKATLQGGHAALVSMDELLRSIKDEKVVGTIRQLRDLAKKILDEVESAPEKLPKVRGFMQYYLPTTIKILQSYRHAESAGIEGANISDLKRRIESMLDPPILGVFHKQLDSLFGDEALDISTDITVLQNMLAQEGLYGEKLGRQMDNESAIELRF